MQHSKGLPMIIPKLQFINAVVSSSRQINTHQKTTYSVPLSGMKSQNLEVTIVPGTWLYHLTTPYHHSLLPRPEGKCLCHILKQLFHPEQDLKHIQETAIGTCWFEHAKDTTSSSRATIIGLEESRKVEECFPCSQDCLRRKGAQCNDYWFQQMAPEAWRRRQSEHKHHCSPTTPVLPGSALQNSTQ